MTDSATANDLASRRVLLLHNRYRAEGGEERYVRQLQALLAGRVASIDLVERRSDEGGRSAAGAALAVGGGRAAAAEVALRVGETTAAVVHAHNVHPAFGFRALAAARKRGAAVVLHLHNYRLFCATGIVHRDGADCTECAPRRTWRGLAHNCRGDRAEAAVYALGLGLWQRRLIESVDLFVAPTRQLAEDLAALGLALPVTVLPTWLPDSEFVDSARSSDGGYALFAGRVTVDKGVLTAVEAAAIAEVPLRVAGDGPGLGAARDLARRLNAPVEFVGRLDAERLAAARAEAAFALVPSLWREVLPFAALEALAAGLPLVVGDRGGLPELTDSEFVFAHGDPRALAERMRALWTDSAARRSASERALARARANHSEAAFLPRLAAVYADASGRRRAAPNLL